MKKIKIVTTNINKFKDFKKNVGSLFEAEHLDIEIPESRDIDVIDVCKNKLDTAYKLTGETNILVEDRGFYIEELNGFPGTHVKLALNTIGVDKLIRLIDSNRKCYFKYVLALLDNTSKSHFFVSYENGTLSETVKIGNDRGWGPLMNIFISSLFPKKTLSELNDEEWSEYKKQFEKDNHFSKFIDYIKE